MTTPTEQGHDFDNLWLRAFRDAVLADPVADVGRMARMVADAEVAKLRRGGHEPACGCRYEAALRGLVARLSPRERSLLLGADVALADAYRAARELVPA